MTLAEPAPRDVESWRLLVYRYARLRPRRLQDGRASGPRWPKMI